MKYLFYIHSHITFYMALQLQEYLKIEKKDVRYVTVRNYKNIYHPDISSLDFSHYYDQLNRAMNLKEAIAALHDIDQKVSDWTGNDDFEFITYSIRIPLWQFIATHKKCKKIHIIEEGSQSYHKKKDSYFFNRPSFSTQIKQFIKKILSKDSRTYQQRAPGFPLFGTEPLFKNTIYYGIYDDVFPFIPQNQKVIFKTLYKDPRFQTQENFDNTTFLIFDAILVEQEKLMNKEEYLHFITPFFHEIAQQKNPFYFKFHPGQDKSITQKLKKMLEEEFYAVELNKDIPVEQIILHHHNIKIYGFFSSLLFYAKRHGHFVKSFLEKTENPKIQQFILNHFNDYFINEIFKIKI